MNVYLDVDGVLNAVSLATPASWGWGESECVRVNGGQIRYSPLLVQRFNALAARPDVQVHWLTTWLDLAPKMLAGAIGLAGESWPVLGEREYQRLDGTWWKLPAASDHFLARRDDRAVWIDDDLLYDGGARRWAEPYVASGALLLVAPETRCGLTRAQFDAIEAWIGGTR